MPDFMDDKEVLLITFEWRSCSQSESSIQYPWYTTKETPTLNLYFIVKPAKDTWNLFQLPLGDGGVNQVSSPSQR